MPNPSATWVSRECMEPVSSAGNEAVSVWHRMKRCHAKFYRLTRGRQAELKRSDMKRVILMNLIVPWIMSGCCTFTETMIGEGLTLQSTPLQEDVTVHRPPLTTKNSRGDLVFEYEAHFLRYGIMGNAGSIKDLGIRRLTNTIPRSSLQKITDAWPGVKWVCPATVSAEAFVPPGQRLPQLERKLWVSGAMIYPPKECLIVDQSAWIWYVPPRMEGDAGMVAMLPNTTRQERPWAVPVKLVLTPIFLAGDIIVWTPFCIYWAFGGTHGFD
jgi:hypothetical protein